MYPSTLCRWRVSRIALRQFTQLARLFKSLLLCNQCITRSLFPLSIPNIRGPSSSRKKLGIPGSDIFTQREWQKSLKDRSLLPKIACATEKEQKKTSGICHKWFSCHAFPIVVLHYKKVSRNSGLKKIAKRKSKFLETFCQKTRNK